MGVALSDADVQRLGPDARRQLARHTIPAETPTPRTTTPRTPAPQSRGASGGTKNAARITRQVYRSAGGGRAGTFSVRAFVWIFVWLGVLFYCVAHPATIPRLVELVFAPINGVIAVANGAAKVAPRTA